MKQDGHEMLFGFSVLLVLAILATILSLGHVEEKTSFGLSFVLGALSSLGAGLRGCDF
jgi:hypothetical protein